jgi:translation initiation factor 4E
LIPTIEHFFNYYVHMKKPNEMPREIDIFFFREHLVPMWEESPNGGIVILKIKKGDDIDKMWEQILFNLLGEQFEEPNVIGASLSLRTKERLLQVWLKDGRNDKLRTNVSNKIRHFLNLDANSITLYYKEHQKSIKDGSTMKNAEGYKFMKVKPNNQKPRAAESGSGSFHKSSGGREYNNNQPRNPNSMRHMSDDFNDNQFRVFNGDQQQRR